MFISIKVGVQKNPYARLQSQPGCTSTCICNTPKYQRNKANKTKLDKTLEIVV